MGLLELSPNPPGYPQITSGYQQALSTDGSGEKLREMGVWLAHLPRFARFILQ